MKFAGVTGSCKSSPHFWMLKKCVLLYRLPGKLPRVFWGHSNSWEEKLSNFPKILVSHFFNGRAEMMISPHNYVYPYLMISLCDFFVCLGPSGVGVNELRRHLIELNPNHFQSAVPRMFNFFFIAVWILVKLSLPLQIYWSHLTKLYHLCCGNIRHKG